MIRSDEELATALEAVTRWLEHPPEHGSADEQRFHILLRDIEDYHPSIEMPPEDQVEPPERAALRRRAADLRRRWRDHPTLMDRVDSVVRAMTGRHA